MFNLRITPDGGETVDVSAGMRDVVMWEKTHRGRSLAELGAGGLTAGMVYELTYAACRRQQLIPRELTEAQFNESYEIEVEDDDVRAARLRAQDLKRRIVDAELPAPPEPDTFDAFTPRHEPEIEEGPDPTLPEA